MGLDMYLEVRKYVSGYSHRPVTEANVYEDLLSLAGISKSDLPESATPSATITIGLMYWRKANAIHQWFVDNVQNGNDDCKPYWVSREQLEELRTICGQIIAEVDKAQELLPTQDGFFFGDTEYDEWYHSAITNTHKELTEVLDSALFKDDWDFYYSASW
jgi:hypothetical protein